MSNRNENKNNNTDTTQVELGVGGERRSRIGLLVLGS
jgi:hypothetical protein